MILLPKGLDRKNVRVDGNIRWHSVDRYLRECTDSGDLKALSQHLGIHVNTLTARRNGLGLGPLRTGRPLTLPERVKSIAEALQTGFTARQAAIQHETTTQAVKRAAGQYARYMATLCEVCAGLGLVASGSASMHVCDECLGTGKAKR